MLKGIKCDFNFLDVLPPKKLQKIQQGTLSILKNTGVKIKDKSALQILADSGVQIDFSNQVAKMSENFVLDMLQKAPSKFTLLARDKKNNCSFASGGSIIITTSPGTNSVDLETWEPVTPSRRDFYNYMHVIDALEHIDMPGSFPWGGFEGVPECMRFIEGLAAKLRTSTKGAWEGSLMDNYRFNVKMAQSIGVDLWHNTNPTAPLTINKETVDQIKHFSLNDQIFSITSAPTMGMTSPTTIAGSIALNNADILATNALAQLYRPGTRTLAGGMFLVLDMMTALPLFANAGNYLAESAFSQIWRDYGLPSTSNSPGWSNSKMLDYQAAYETTTGLITVALSGATVIAFAGGLTAELTGHPVKAVIDNEIVGMVKRFLQGIDVNEETLAIDLVDEVGFAPTMYLAEEHTLKWFKHERYTPTIGDFLPIPKWIAGGKKTLIEHGRDRMEEILQNHKIGMLEPAQEQAIEDVLNEARNYYRKTGDISESDWEIYKRSLASPDYPFA